jgi:hypothetical protein
MEHDNMRRAAHGRSPAKLLSPGRGIELCWEASRASIRRPEWRGSAAAPPPHPFWRNSDKIPEVWRRASERT